MKTDFLIIGGGVAGLSAANRLAEAGTDVTLLEAGTYPAHKVCGEFLSPEALPILEKWGIAPAASVTDVELEMPNKQWSMKLPKAAATLPRYILDDALAQRARKLGAMIQTGARVEGIDIPKSEGQRFTVNLASGEVWSSPILLLSTGRLPSQKRPTFSYVGVKAHFEGINIAKRLKMYLSPGAYFGMAPIGENKVNVAGLIASTTIEACHPNAVLDAFLKRGGTQPLLEALASGQCLFDDWLVGPVPEFGVRDQTSWPNTFSMGDAAGVIPPATGNGLAMGVTSGVLAAEYALRGQPKAYREAWRKEYGARISKGKLLHRLFLSSWLSGAIPFVSRVLPFLPNALFHATRGEVLLDNK